MCYVVTYQKNPSCLVACFDTFLYLCFEFSFTFKFFGVKNILCALNGKENDETFFHSTVMILNFLARLSQRLIGELIGYSWSGIHPSSSSIVVYNFKHLLLQNRLPDQSQILCGASLGRGTKVCSRHLGHMTKIGAIPIYGKNPSKIFFSRQADFHETCYVVLGTPAHHSLFK